MDTLSVDSLHVNCSVPEFMNLGELYERRLYLFGEIASVDSSTDDFFPAASPVSVLVKKIFSINFEDKDVPLEKREPIFLYINSPGGELTEGFSLIATMELSKTPIYTVNIGEWCSMAFLIGITGDRRYSLPYMTFLMHEASGISVGKISSMEEKISFNRHFSENVIKKHVLKHSKLSEKDYNLIANKELYLLPEEAKDYGFIDEIITDIDVIL